MAGPIGREGAPHGRLPRGGSSPNWGPLRHEAIIDWVIANVPYQSLVKESWGHTGVTRLYKHILPYSSYPKSDARSQWTLTSFGSQ